MRTSGTINGRAAGSGAMGGTMLCLASAAAFGAMGIFGRLAYDGGATAGTLLSVRFALAAALGWALVVASGDLRALNRRDALAALGLGAAGYAAQAGGYFAALERIDPGQLALLVYTFPAIVAVAAVVLGRERMDARRLAALALVSAGLVLVLAGGGIGARDALGTALGLATAVLYSGYVLVSEDIAGRMPPRLLSALVCSGAAVTLTGGSLALGELRPGEPAIEAWGWLACLAVVSTVGAVGLFFAGLRRVGPTAASILSTVEPVVTVALAFLAFGDVLGAAQLGGGALVLGGVVVLRGPVRGRRAPRRT